MQLDDGGRGPYDAATSANIDPSFLKDPVTGEPILGEGLEVNLDDLTGYAGTLDRIRTNYGGLSRTTTQGIRSMITATFVEGGNLAFEWSQFFHRLANHNAGQLELFNASIATGIRNVAMAAQTVANVYAGTDEESAANLRAIDFAFGDRSKAPGSLPSWYVDQVPTWNELAEENPAAAGVPVGGGPRARVRVDGHLTTTTERLPDGRVMTTVTEQGPTTGPSTRSSSTRSVYIDGVLHSVVSTATVGSRTTTTTTTTVYDQDGQRVRDEVTSRDTETVTAQADNLRTDRRSREFLRLPSAGRPIGGRHPALRPPVRSGRRVSRRRSPPFRRVRHRC